MKFENNLSIIHHAVPQQRGSKNVGYTGTYAFQYLSRFYIIIEFLVAQNAPFGSPWRPNAI